MTAPTLGSWLAPPGSGKTTALRLYENEMPGCWIATLSPSFGSLRPGLIRVRDALISGSPHHGAFLVRQEIEHFLEMWCFDTRPALVVVDEAQHAKRALLEELRSIHDEIGVGLVLCGNPDFGGWFRGQSGLTRFAQLSSRVGARLDLGAPTSADIGALCHGFGVAGVRMQEFVDRLAGRGGGLRAAARLRTAAEQMAGSDAVSLAHLQAAARLLGLHDR